MTFPDKGIAGPPPARELPDSHIRDKDVPLPPVQDAIQDRLRASYAAILSEPIPQRFVDLLSRLDDSEPEDGR